MNAYFKSKVQGAKPECQFCRHARTEIQGDQFVTACKREHPIMIAESCKDYRDSRRPLAANYLKGIGANG